MPIDAGERRLRGLVAVGRWILVGTNDVWAGVGAAHADVDHRHAETRHLGDPRQRLGQVRLERILCVGAPGAGERRLERDRLALVAAGALAEGNRIVDVEPAGDHEIRRCGAEGGDDFPGQPGAVFEAAAVGPASISLSR